MRRWCLIVVVAACKPEAPPPAPPALKVAPTAAPKPEIDRTRSLVTVRCGEVDAPGFFITPDRVATRALCDAPRVKLFDGRTLLAKVMVAQKDLELAELEVAGGEGEPLTVGGSARLRDTDDVQVPGSGRGTVRELVRTRLGVPHIEVAFERVVARGSPVLDSSGAVVGVVADQAMVLPIEALGPQPEWNEVQLRAKTAIARETAAFRAALARPALVAALVDGNGALHAVLLARTPQPRVAFDLGGCKVDLGAAWESFRMSAWFDEPTHALYQYIDKYDLDVGLSVSTLQLPATSCTATELVLENADPLFSRATIGKTSLVMPATAKPPAPLPPRSTSTVKGPNEREWRARFQALKAERDRFETEMAEKQRFVERLDDDTIHGVYRYQRMSQSTAIKYEQYKKDLAEAGEWRAAYQRRADELEREASNASVPREWRQ